MSEEELYIQRCLELAKLGVGLVSPNPQVGCVIVKDEQIIGEGWHKQYGQAHAEVNAVNSVKDKAQLVGSTVYINLEPCSHFGKTPPCTDLLIKHQVKKVVISNLDSNPVVSGNGIRKLKEAGIDVMTGILEREGRQVNRRFFTFHEKNRPYILLKWAQTSDGFIARSNYESHWISNEYSRKQVHRWRSEEDAVLVGTKTAAHDNPRLTVRDWSGRNPVRLVIDRFLRLSDKLNVFDQTVPTYCFNLLKHEEHPNLSLIRLDEKNFITAMLDFLYQRNIQSIMVEGGALTLSLFIESDLWDEARIFISPRSFHSGIQTPGITGRLVLEDKIQEDTLKVFMNDQVKI